MLGEKIVIGAVTIVVVTTKEKRIYVVLMNGKSEKSFDSLEDAIIYILKILGKKEIMMNLSKKMGEELKKKEEEEKQKVKTPSKKTGR
jgi:hypothetical protein